MISGAGMLDSLACHSLEKLVIDAEAIASALRLRRGINVDFTSFATEAFAQTGLTGDFLKLKETRMAEDYREVVKRRVLDENSFVQMMLKGKLRGAEVPWRYCSNNYDVEDIALLGCGQPAWPATI